LGFKLFLVGFGQVVRWLFSSVSTNSDIVVRCFASWNCAINGGSEKKKLKQKKNIIKSMENVFFFVAPIIITFVHYLVVAAGICIDLSQYLFIY